MPDKIYCNIYCYDVDKMLISDDYNCGDEFLSGEYFPIEMCNNTMGFDSNYVGEDLKPNIEKDKKNCKSN